MLNVVHGWTDSVGGYHADGCGISPGGKRCGECSEATCEPCPIYKKELEDMIDEDHGRQATLIESRTPTAYLTSTGWRTRDSLKSGDEVLNHQGKPFKINLKADETGQ